MLFRKKIPALALITILGLCLAAALYLLLEKDAFRAIPEFLNKNTHPALFMVLYVILPILGFPLSIFLVLLGIRFGSLYGVLIMSAGMPIHLLASFAIANSFVRPWIEGLAKKRGFSVPRIPEGRQIWFSFLFMAVPGLPYALKNYLFSLSGVSFPVILILGSLINAALGVPIVILGGAARELNIALLLVLAVLVSLIYVWRYRAKKKLQSPPP